MLTQTYVFRNNNVKYIALLHKLSVLCYRTFHLKNCTRMLNTPNI